MKKSKFLQNSKDMLSRSFNPTKCKTSLRLAISRLKLLRNKKEVQVNQMKREIAQLLEAGQNQTAKIRVEHVIREEKMMGAYDLLEIYCELSIARLPIIEAQKNCPIDMKEAIASIVFASPRCGDVPELLDVRKQFSAKYGKEFISAAIELRPQCGVSRLLVEKLSATAPDGQTKIKILSTIAEGHDVKWDPTSFDDKHSGGTSSIKENDLYSDPPHFEAAEVDAHPSSNMNSLTLNSVKHDVKSSTGAENLPRAQTSGASTTFEPKVGTAGEEMPHKVTHNNLPNGQKWDMEFKDAASAAQAAAESAERASYAARAAAELSSHGRTSGQYSTESHISDAHILKDDGFETPGNLNSFQRVSEASVSKSSSEYAGLGNEQIDRNKPTSPVTSTRSDVGGHGGSKEYNQAVSSKSKASADDDALYHSIPSVHEYIQEKSAKEVSEPKMVIKNQASSYETEYESGWPEKVENLGEGIIKEHRSYSPSHSQSCISDYVNIFANSEEQKFENDIGENPSVNFSKPAIHDEAPCTSSHDFVAAAFDHSDTDNDGPVFDRGPVYDEQDLEFHLHSLGQNSPERTLTNTDLWNPGSSSSKKAKPTSPPSFTREESFPDVSEITRLGEDSELDDFPAVRFDHSDGPSSESEDEDRNASVVEDSRDNSRQQNERGRIVNLQYEEEAVSPIGSPSKNEGSSAFGSKKIVLSSDDELSSSDETHWKRSQLKMFRADSPEKLGDLKPSSKDSRIELNGIGNESDEESGEGLNFGKLTGGFHHKGHDHLTFFKNRLDTVSSVRKEVGTTTIHTSSPVLSLAGHPYIGITPEYKTTSTTEDLHTEAADDSSEEELQKKQPLSALTVKTKLTLGSSNPVFGSDDSDLDHSPRESVTRKSHMRGGISRRTKAHPSSSTRKSNPEMHQRSEAALGSDGGDRKPTTSYTTEAPKRHDSNRRNSGAQEKYEKPISGVTSVTATSNTWGSTEVSNSSKTSVSKQESKERLKSKAHDSDNSMGDQVEFHPSSGKSNRRLGTSEQQPHVAANLSSWQTSENPTSGKSTSNVVQKSKVSQTSSAVEEVANLQQNADASFSSEKPKKSSTMDKPSLSKDDSSKKPSHVHPKLPDYDALVQSLRYNRS